MDILGSLTQQGTTSTALTATTFGVSAYNLVICILVSLALGVAIALVYAWRERHTRSFVTALALIPAIVCVVIALVNGNIGAGVAVAGAFSLVRFRSAPGTGRDIAFVFLAMAVGLATGMGYLVIAAIVTAVISLAYLLLSVSPFGGRDEAERILNVSVPESIDYVNMFDEVISAHTGSHQLLSVKTGAMGTVYKLRYSIQSRGVEEDKQLIDAIRCLNGNMEVSVTEAASNALSDL